MTSTELKNIFNSFNGKKVLVIGDAMIDTYMWGSINRMSPEAPVPVVDIEKYEIRLGGAANCALNIKALGAEPILCSVVGKDINGNQFQRLMKEANLSNKGIILSDTRKTTVKTRVISEGKHQIRIDKEDTHPLQIEEEFFKIIHQLFENTEVVILQDYNKGVLTKKNIAKIISEAKKRGIPTIVDPKKDNFLEYKDCDIFKPNLKEIKEGMEIDFNEKIDSELKNATHKLKQELNAKGILLTLSSDGICINSDEGFVHTAAYGGSVVDVSGAGDTVISVAALLLSEGVSFKNISKISCLSGGIVCQKVGVVPIDKEELFSEALQII